jgi:hypothetical protein
MEKADYCQFLFLFMVAVRKMSIPGHISEQAKSRRSVSLINGSSDCQVKVYYVVAYTPSKSVLGRAQAFHVGLANIFANELFSTYRHGMILSGTKMG